MTVWRVSGVTGVPPVSSYRKRILEALQRIRETKSIDKMVHMQMLRALIDETPFVEMLNIISLIDNQDDLNVLMGIGMKGELYYSVIARKAKVMGV